VRALFLAAVLMMPAIASGQVPAAPAAAMAIEPARLAAARRVVETVFPAAQREQMMTAMVGSMNKAMLGSLMQQPDIARMIEKEPRARPVFERFMQRQQNKTAATMKDNLPGMVDAMANAYARRFTEAQLKEMQSFFETPTGRVYIAQSMTIMSDPDVAAWQARVQSASIATIGADAKEFVQELMALAPAKEAKQ
jgi:hypothetical protein